MKTCSRLFRSRRVFIAGGRPRRHLLNAAVFVGIFMLFSAAADRARGLDLYWRTDGTTGGNWSSTFWNPGSATATGGTGWTAAANAFFTGTSTLTFATNTIGNVSLADGVAVTVSSAGTLTLGGVRTFDIGTGSTLTWTSQSQSTATGNEGAGIIKNGAGTLNWGAGPGTNARYDGGFTLNAGTVIVSGTNSLSSGVMTFNGGTLQSSGSLTYTSSSVVIGGDFAFAGTGNDIWNQAVSLGAATRTITNNTTGGATRTFSNAISGGAGAGLTFAGSGNTTFAGASANTYTGLTTISGGELDLNKTAGVNAIAGDGNTATNDITVNGGILKWLANEQVGNTATITISSGTVDLNGKIETLGTLINNGGTFQTGAGHLIGTTASIEWNAGTNTINSGGIVEDGHIKITGGTNTVQGGASEGLLHLLSGGVGLQMTGATLTLNSDAANAGRLLLEGNVMTTASATSSVIASGGNATNAGIVDLNTGTRTFDVAAGTVGGGGPTGGSDLLISAKVTNPGGSIDKMGAGILELTGANTYAGGTMVDAGTLLVNNITGSGTGSAGVMVNNTGTLGGTGFINAGSNNININAGGTITGGKNGTVGALTMTAMSLVFTGTDGNLATYAVDILNATSDTLNLTGILDLSGTFDQITFNGTADGTTTYVLATYSSVTGTFDNMPSLPSGYSLVYGTMELDLAPTVVPEPGSWAAGILALGGLVMSQRRRLSQLLKRG